MLLEQDKNSDSSIPALSSLYFYLTSYCNLSCLHCWIAPKYLDKEEAPEEAPFSLLKEIITQALPLGLRNIKITGGEPFLNKNALGLINYAFFKKLNITIETNATLINDSIAAFLKENKVSHIAVSLDGPNAKVHEIMRGRKDCFEKALASINLLKKYGLNTQIIFSLYKDNRNYLEETIKLAEDYGVNSFKINCVSHISRGGSLKTAGMILEIPDYLKINKEIEEEIQPRYKIRIIFDIPPAFKRLKQVRTGGRCNIKNIAGVLPDGQISICGIGEVLPSLVLGDIRQDTLENIWKNSPIFRSIRENFPGKLEGICARCILKAYCLGKCRAEAYYDTHSLFSPFSFCDEAFQLGLFPQERTFIAKQEVGV